MQPKRASLNLPTKKEQATPVKTVQQEGNVKEIEVKKVIFRLSATAKKQFDRLALDEDKTKQDLFSEALNDLFRKYGKPEIV